ncbi:MAG: Gfo/Idh/MocA family oxidoreductase [Ruminococcaceae bacterium]|nr:Gfo/Idh/MocA family oxidoreductase [Oscillospiraceae bacterium]
MERRVNIGIIGFGSMGKTHASCIEDMKYYYSGLGIEPVLYGVCASSPENSKKYAEKYGFERAFSSPEELIICPEIDVVDICTPNIFHYEQLKAAIAAGKHIYCEKPLCTTPEQAEEICTLAEKTNSVCAVVFNTRFHLPVIRAKEIIEKGGIGDIVSFNVSFLHSSATDVNRTGWKQDKTVCGGGVLFDLGSHAVDMTRYLCGDFEKVFGKSQIAFPERRSFDGRENWKTNADETFYIIAELKNKAVGNITVSKIHQGTNDDFNFEIYGTKGSLKFGLMDPNWLYYYDATAPEKVRGVTRIECVGRFDFPATGFPGAKATVGWLRGHIGSMHNFLEGVAENKAVEPSFRDGAVVQRILDAAYRSDEIGGFMQC